MIRTGKNGEIFQVSYVKHELRKDMEVTLFSIADYVVDRSGQPFLLPNGYKKRIYYQVTVWEDLPLVDGQQVRLLYISDLQAFQMKDKHGYEKTYFSFSAKVEIMP